MDETSAHEQAQCWAERLRALLQHRGWTGRELGRRADLSPSLVAMVLRGEAANLTDKSKRRIAQAFGWPDWDALLGTEVLTPPAQKDTEELEAIKRLLWEALRRLEDAGERPNSISDAVAAEFALSPILATA